MDVDSWDYAATQVLTEWKNIDILVRNDEVGFVGVIENKIGSAEHSEQLRRYREPVEGQYPKYSKLFVYLTVEGDEPSDESYVSVTYGEVASLVADVVDRRSDQMGPEARSFMAQYVEMLRRHIVEDSEIQELCRRIYHTHRRALDTIFEYRPDRTLELSEFLQERLKGEAGLIRDHGSKSYVRFLPAALDFLPSGSGWTKSGRLLLFELDLTSSDVRLKVLVGPGPDPYRARIQSWVKERAKVFNRATSRFYPQWWSFHSERWIPKAQFESLEVEDLKGHADARLSEFLDARLPAMVDALSGLSDLEWPEDE